MLGLLNPLPKNKIGGNVKRGKKKRLLKPQQVNDDLKGAKHRELDSIKFLINNGNLTKGYSELLRYTEKYPNDPYAHRLLGQILLKRKDPEGALQAFKVVVAAHDKTYHSGLLGMANAYYQAGNIDKARDYYEQAIDNNPYEETIAYLTLSRLESDEGNYYRALNLLYSALDLEPKQHAKRNYDRFYDKNDVLLQIAKNLILIGEEDKADDILSSINPENKYQAKEFAYSKGIIYRVRKQYFEALKTLDEVRELPEKDKLYYIATLEQARLYQQLGMIDEQLERLEELERDNMLFGGETLVSMGLAKLTKKDYDGAKETFKKAMETSSQNLKYYATFHYSALQYLGGNIQETEATLTNFISNSTFPSRLNYISLIRILYDQERYLEASSYIKEAQARMSDADSKREFKKLEILVNQKQGKKLPPINQNSYLERQLANYSVEEAIRYNTNKNLEDNRFVLSKDITTLYEDVLPFLIEDNKLMVNILDEYKVSYPNAGSIDGKIVDTLRVKALPGTTQIITISLCDEFLLPTIGELKQEKEKQKSKINARIARFNERLAKSSTNKQ